jgi:hypothetical protein
MASPQAVNRQVALALGRVIIPLDKADCHTHAEGVKYLYSSKSELYRKVHGGGWRTTPDVTDRFSPATDPADALACLEEWCKAKRVNASLTFWPSTYEPWGVQLNNGSGNISTNLQTAICQAIIHAEAGK